MTALVRGTLAITEAVAGQRFLKQLRNSPSDVNPQLQIIDPYRHA